MQKIIKADSFLSSIEEILTDLSDGKLVVIVDDENRENEGDLVFVADKVSAKKINFMAKYARGLICLALERSKVEKLELNLMSNNNLSRHKTAFTVSIEAKEGVTTGISAQDRAQTIKVAVRKKTKSSDLVSPGHIFPLVAKDGGVLIRAGHTEAAVDLARLTGKSPAGVICEIMNDDGTMARFDDLVKFSNKYDLKMASIKDLIAYRIRKEKFVECIKKKSFKTNFAGEFKLIVYKNQIDGSEHIALVKGKIKKTSVCLVRMHSFNIFEDFLSLFTAEDKDLKNCMKIINKNKSGVIVIIRNPQNEAKKIDVKPRNTENLVLKEYGIGAQILLELGIKKICLLTNRSKSIIGIDGFGLKVCGRKKIN